MRNEAAFLCLNSTGVITAAAKGGHQAFFHLLLSVCGEILG